MQQCVRDLFAPMKSCFSPGGARVRLGVTGAHFSQAAEELEGFARPLWGLAPLAAGGGAFDDWPLYQRGLANGSNPQHAEFWGDPSVHFDQRLVEYAAIGFALLLAPDQAWKPLSAATQANLAAWLGRIHHAPVPDTNWLFFRVLTILGLARVGAPHDWAASSKALDRLEEFYLGDGWYQDGPNNHCDYYIAFAFHFYSLIYSVHAVETDPERVGRFKERAARFAEEFIHMFAADGAAIPYGRSLTYRFAQGAFWGALAYANVEVMEWGVVKGLLLRHLRAWFRQPIFDNAGILSIGYSYPNLFMAEHYNSSSSPYWAMKAFLPLALPESHPFWQSEEKPLPALNKARVMKHPGFVICRDAEQNHVVAFGNAGNGRKAYDFGTSFEKYGKFAYSTRFAFSIPTSHWSTKNLACDSMLAVCEDGTYFRTRIESVEVSIDGDVLYSKWRPWRETEDVEIETWIAPGLPWHVRAHRIRTNKKLVTYEGGFAIDASADEGPKLSGRREEGPGFALAGSPTGACGIRDLEGKRRGEICFADPNTNLHHPRTRIPSLRDEYEPGEHWLICAVFAVVPPDDIEPFWSQPPVIQRQTGSFQIIDPMTRESILAVDI
jgi:hypothetical protein